MVRALAGAQDLAQPACRVVGSLMGRIDDRLEELGLTLPEPMAPPGNFELVTVHAGIAYIAGHAPIDGSAVLVEGAVGRELTLEEGYRAARLTGLSIFVSLKHAFSDLVVEVWGDAGRHARSAPGQGPSPLNVPIIVDALVAVSERAADRARDLSASSLVPCATQSLTVT